MSKQRNLLGSNSIAWSIAIVGALLHPMAQADFANPAKTSDIIVSVDGNAVDISITANRAAPGALVASEDALLASITTNPTNATNGNVTDKATTTNGSGSGARVSLVISGGTVTGVTVVKEGAGYQQGDTLTVASNDIPGTNTDLVFTLVIDDIDNLEALPFAAFGNGDSGGNSSNELSLLRAVKGGGEVRLLAQGGVVEIDCSNDNGGGTQYYQRARVTLGTLPSAAKDVWAFYDPRVGASSKGQPHFNAEDGFSDAWPRIAASGDQIKLCDGNTPYVDGTPGQLVLGNDNPSRTTAGMKKQIASGVTTAHFDVYVPMEGRGNSTTTGITLAMGFVIDVGQNGTLDDTSADVAFEAWVSSEPWWDSPPGQNGNETDEFNTLLPICNSPSAEDPACIISTSGIFADDGTTRIVDANDFSAWTTQIAGEEGEGAVFDSIIDLAPTASFDNTGFAIPTGSIVRIEVSWPTAGSVFGGDLQYGVGNDEIDLLKLAADTPVRVNTAEDNTVTNTWTNVKDGDRVVSTLIGEARATSAAISRETWWPQCDVEFNQAGEVVSDKCGADMTSNVTNDYMVFSSVPARLAVIVEEQVRDVAGGIVSTNGQGFAFGRQTFAETDPAYEFTSSGPSYDSAGAGRSADGFYYVCLPATYLDKVHSTTASVAAGGAWVGTRKDGNATAQSLNVTFTEGTCGLNDAGLVASVASFGYSSPVFQLRSGAPGQPTITQVTMGNGQAVVTYTAPANPGSSAITQYVVTANPGGITKNCGTTSPCTVTGLNNGTNYTFTITATNDNGTSSPSPSVVVAGVTGVTPVPTLPKMLLLLMVFSLLSLVGLRGVASS